MVKGLKSVTNFTCTKKYDRTTIIKVPIIAQNTNGYMILGKRLPKKSFISQSRPRDNAPDSIKNKSAPILNELFAKSSQNPKGV